MQLGRADMPGRAGLAKSLALLLLPQASGKDLHGRHDGGRHGRRSLGKVGGFVPASFTEPPSIDGQREAVRRIEAAGYPAAWSNEPVGGKDVFAQVAVLLAATERLTFATGIANIWARIPQIANAAAALLAQAYPDRFVLGLGVGYPQQAELAGRDSAGRWRPCATTWSG